MGVFEFNEMWNLILIMLGDIYEWNDESIYIYELLFFFEVFLNSKMIMLIECVWVLVLFGDSVIIDYILLVGVIVIDSLVGCYFVEKGVEW